MLLRRDIQIRNDHLNRLQARQGGFPLFPDPPGQGGDDQEPSVSHPPNTPTPTPRPSTTSRSSTTSRASSTVPTSARPPPTSSASRPTTPASASRPDPTVSQPSDTLTQTPTVPTGPTLSVPNRINTDYTPGQNTIDPSATNAPTDTPNDTSSGGGTMKYIGYAAGGLLGLALVIAGIMFIMRRINKRREDEALGDVFDRHSFVRDSVALPNQVDEPASDRGRPRPPTMIDRHVRNANNTPYNEYGGGGYGGPQMQQNDYYGNNGYSTGPGYDQYGNLGYNNGNGGYDQYDQYDQYGQYGHGGPYSPYQDSPAGGDAYGDQYHQNGTNYPALPPAAAAAPGSPTEPGRSLTRQPSSRVPGVNYPDVAELGRGTSVTPFQAQQYAEIGRRLDDPSGPTDPGSSYNRADRGGPAHGQRPQSTYRDDDAYGGI